MEHEKPTRSFLTIPGAIIIAGAIIAVGIIWTKKPAPTAASGYATAAQPATINMRAVDSTDHILGNPDAPIKIVEYSDPSCPYCKLFNPIMTQVMDQYGASGQVAWVYRDFPLDKPDANGNVLHPLAGYQAQALECAGTLGGNDVFWKYEKEWYTIFPSDGADESVATDQAQVAQVGKDVGLDPVAFNDCISSGETQARIDQDYLDGVNVGVSGTPYSVLVTPTGTKIPLPGVQSLATMQTAINSLLPETQTGSQASGQTTGQAAGDTAGQDQASQ